MKAELKSKWIEALKSGNYKQGRDALYRITDKKEHKFCCLGVLAHIAIEAPWEEDAFGFYTFKGNGGNTANLGVGVRRKLGLTSGEHFALTSRNDEGWSFKRLAAYIEKNI